MTLIIKLLAVAYSMIGTVTVHLKSSKNTNKQKTESNSQNPKQKKGKSTVKLKCVRKLKQKYDDNKCVWNILKLFFSL